MTTSRSPFFDVSCRLLFFFRATACPCNAFGGQEPAPNHEIVQFTQNKGVTFPVVGKLECENGDNTHPLYKMLRSSVSSGFADTILGQSIKWV